MILLIAVPVLRALTFASVVLGVFALTGLSVVALATIWCVRDWVEWWRA